jgi:hypothetical protein
LPVLILLDAIDRFLAESDTSFELLQAAKTAAQIPVNTKWIIGNLF